MPDAATIAAWGSVLSTVISVLLLGGMGRLLYLYGQYNRRLREMLDVYDPEKVNKRMKAIKDQAELAVETKIRDLEKEVASKATTVESLNQSFIKLFRRYEIVKSTFAIDLLSKPPVVSALILEGYVPELVRDDVRQRMEQLRASFPEAQPSPPSGFARLLRPGG